VLTYLVSHSPAHFPGESCVAEGYPLSGVVVRVGRGERGERRERRRGEERDEARSGEERRGEEKEGR
jgi:hypothetical protein